MDVALKNPSELAFRLKLASGRRLLVVDGPDSLLALASAERGDTLETRAVEGKAIRAVKGTYDAVLLWREDRTGSHAVLEAVAKRTEPGGAVWAVVPLRKATGLAIPAARRLTLDDLTRAFSSAEWTRDREARVTAWHVGYRFVKRPYPT